MGQLKSTHSIEPALKGTYREHPKKHGIYFRDRTRCGWPGQFSARLSAVSGSTHCGCRRAQYRCADACSIGFAAFPVIESAPDAHPWEDVVKMADQCLYAAKHSGRDAWVGLVPSETDTDAGARMATELGALAASG